ncbi:MAG: hypothetical protein WBK67_01200 [Minisyncoccales bacterium]|jgi:hypothetical protein
MDNRCLAGWVLLSLGVILIIWILYTSYGVFTGGRIAPNIFEKEEIVSVEKPKVSVDLNDPEIDLNQIMAEQIQSTIPFDAIFDILNLISWSILSFIVIFGGSKISGLGIKLLKK